MSSEYFRPFVTGYKGTHHYYELLCEVGRGWRRSLELLDRQPVGTWYVSYQSVSQYKHVIYMNTESKYHYNLAQNGMHCE